MEEEKEVEIVTKLYSPLGSPIVITFLGTNEYRMENGDVVIIKDGKSVGRVAESVVAAVHTGEVEVSSDEIDLGIED